MCVLRLPALSVVGTGFLEEVMERKLIYFFFFISGFQAVGLITISEMQPQTITKPPP